MFPEEITTAFMISRIITGSDKGGSHHFGCSHYTLGVILIINGSQKLLVYTVDGDNFQFHVTSIMQDY
jgi:hypothetical protein